MEDLKLLQDHKFDDLKAKLELEIDNLQKQLMPAKLELNDPEIKEEKKKNLEDEIELLDSEIVKREEQIKLIDAEVKHRADLRLQIDDLFKEIAFSEILEGEEKPFIDHILHHVDFCDHIELKEDLIIDDVVQLDDEGLPIKILKEIKHIPWNKKAVLKELKLKLDLDKAKQLVDNIKSFKHNFKKGKLEAKLRLLVQNNVYFLEAFGDEIEIINGERHGVHHSDRIARWDKDDLEFFEDKILKMELAKKHMDEKERIQKPIDDRIRAYKAVDGQLLEALIEKLEENRPEKMVKYLELRKDIKNRHPLEE
jgi:hypothetical protein